MAIVDWFFFIFPSKLIKAGGGGGELGRWLMWREKRRERKVELESQKSKLRDLMQKGGGGEIGTFVDWFSLIVDFFV